MYYTVIIIIVLVWKGMVMTNFDVTILIVFIKLQFYVIDISGFEQVSGSTLNN